MTITCQEVKVTGEFHKRLEVELDVDPADLIRQLGAKEFLDAIGQDAAIEHFGISTQEDDE